LNLAGTHVAPAVVGRSTPKTFEEVYDENVDFVWRVVARLGVRPESVEDVAQEVFMVVSRKLPEFQGLSSVRTWLFQIARRVVHDHRRTVRRKEPPLDRGPTGEPVDVEALCASDEHAPDVAAARSEAGRLLHAILDDLDDEKREVFVLAELEELPAPQIADAIGINVNTVYSRLRLARAAFNQALARHQAHHNHARAAHAAHAHQRSGR
jgi:RNA polymerase sigma-70 factor (ECF subfamily)